MRIRERQRLTGLRALPHEREGAGTNGDRIPRLAATRAYLLRISRSMRKGPRERCHGTGVATSVRDAMRGAGSALLRAQPAPEINRRHLTLSNSGAAKP